MIANIGILLGILGILFSMCAIVSAHAMKDKIDKLEAKIDSFVEEMEEPNC